MINLLALLMLISQVDYQEEIRNEKLKNEEINKSNYEKNNKIQQRQNNSKIQSENHRNRRNVDTSKHIHMTTQSPHIFLFYIYRHTSDTRCITLIAWGMYRIEII
jgi:hypothetical protein